MPKQKKESGSLNGWQQIADFLGQPSSVAQRWAKSGMPVIHDGRRVHASPDELNRWLVGESAGEPVQIATDSTDLGAELRRGLSFVRKQGRMHKEESSVRQRLRRERLRTLLGPLESFLGSRVLKDEIIVIGKSVASIAYCKPPDLLVPSKYGS